MAPSLNTSTHQNLNEEKNIGLCFLKKYYFLSKNQTRYKVKRECNSIKILRHKELQRQKLLLSNLTISIDFVHHLKHRCDEFLKFIFKSILVK